MNYVIVYFVGVLIIVGSADWRLAAPIIIANLSVPLLGAVDTAVIGHLDQSFYLGAVAIGALISSPSMIGAAAASRPPGGQTSCTSPSAWACASTAVSAKALAFLA